MQSVDVELVRNTVPVIQKENVLAEMDLLGISVINVCQEDMDPLLSSYLLPFVHLILR